LFCRKTDRRIALKKDEKSGWSSEFSFDSEGNEVQKGFSTEIVNESYEALNKFYQKETRKNKVVFKKGKPIWL
jgi:hypothetical protein